MAVSADAGVAAGGSAVGSAVQVVSPPELAEKVIEQAKKVIEKQEKVK